MRITALLAALLAAGLVLPASVQAKPTGRQAHVRPRSNAWEAKVIRLTNDRRRAHGVKALRAAQCPDRLAERWTRHMARTHDFEHQPLDPFFRCPHTSIAAENIAAGYESPHALVSAWMHSPGHRANILNPHFNRIGLSGWRATNGVTYATQDFIG